MDRPRLIIMQGKPATAKSTIAKAIASNTDTIGKPVIVSADNHLYFKGRYIYTPERQAEAHQECETRAEHAMHEQASIVIVDNTNLKYSWAEKYFRLAYKYGYDIQVIRVDTPWSLQVNQNDVRDIDRKVPIEKYRDFIMDDLLVEHSGLSYSQCWRRLFFSLRALFSLRRLRIKKMLM